MASELLQEQASWLVCICACHITCVKFRRTEQISVNAGSTCAYMFRVQFYIHLRLLTSRGKAKFFFAVSNMHCTNASQHSSCHLCNIATKCMHVFLFLVAGSDTLVSSELFIF